MGRLTQIYLFLTPTGEFQVAIEFTFANSPFSVCFFIMVYWTLGLGFFFVFFFFLLMAKKLVLVGHRKD